MTDTEVLACTSISSIFTLLCKSHLRWASHISQIKDDRILKKLLCGELKCGRNVVERLKKRYKDSMKETLKAYKMNPDSWEVYPINFSIWCFAISSKCWVPQKNGEYTISGKQWSKYSRRFQEIKINTGGSRLSQIFWEHENQSGLLVIRLIYSKLYRKMENKFWKKKSGLSGNPA